MKILVRIAALFMILAVIGALAAGGVVLALLPGLPDAGEIRDVELKVPLRVYAANGELVAEFGEQRREPVRIEEVPEVLVQAVLAAEDDSFYSHPGVDFMGVIRAAIKNFQSGQTGQGASTITMQVARNYFLSREKTYTRKAREALLAFRLERMFSKDQILELYLNKIFLGHRSYGFAAAARIYYGKKLEELTLPQAALLAGLPKAPSRDNPLTSPERALKRRAYVLSRMHELGYIDDARYIAARDAPLSAERHRIAADVEAPWVAEMVREYMVNRYGEQAYWEGYKVYTTVDPALQHNANSTLRNGLLDYSHRHGYRGPVASIELRGDTDSAALDEALEEYPPSGELLPGVVIAVADRTATVYTRRQQVVEVPWQGLAWAQPYRSATRVGAKPESAADVVAAGDVVYVAPGEEDGWRLTQVPVVEGGLVSLDPRDGAILALTGGFDFYLNRYNRITQAERQPGSNIKPFIYSAALKYGFTPASQVSGGPIVVEDRARGELWRPENYSGKFYGPMPLRTGLMKSVNLVAVRILRSVGLDNAREHLARFGFDPESLPNGLSLALGSGSVRPLTVARAFGVMANGGYLVEPYFIKWVEDRDGNIIEQARPSVACNYCSVSSAETQRDPPFYAPRVLSPENRFLITSMLRDVVKGGTGQRAMALGRNDLAGKTGTTNDFRDAWFSGFNDAMVTTVWVGFDDSRTLGRGEAGSRAALPIWVDYMEEALQGVPESPLLKPDNVVTARVSPATGQLVAEGQGGGVLEYFEIGTVPRGGATYQGGGASSGDGVSTEGLF